MYFLNLGIFAVFLPKPDSVLYEMVHTISGRKSGQKGLKKSQGLNMEEMTAFAIKVHQFVYKQRLGILVKQGSVAEKSRELWFWLGIKIPEMA